MRILQIFLSPAFAALAILLMCTPDQPAFAQEAVRPAPAPALISREEARVIIEGAIAFTRQRNMSMAVVVVDQSGYVVSSDRMDGSSFRNMRFAAGKAFASALYGQSTEILGALATTRPDRFFGIMNMHPGKVYLVGGGVPLAVDGVQVGAVGVAGQSQGSDDMAARAGIAAWESFRASGE